MRFLKASVVVLFLLSLTACGLTFFLSTVRENEKEKRIHLEQVRDQLQQKIEALEAEKADLQGQVDELAAQVYDFEAKTKDLEGKLALEQKERARATELIRKKENEISALRTQLNEVEKAFAAADKRRNELEKMLDEVEVKLKEAEAKLAAPPLPQVEAGFTQLDLQPPAALPRAVSAQPAVPEPAPLPPKPGKEPQVKKKKKGFFSSFLGPRYSKRVKKVKAAPETKQEAPARAPQSEPQPVPAPEPEPAKPEAAPTVVKPVAVQALKVEELKVQAHPQPAQKEEGPKDGKVLLINRKFNFVVTDLGSKHGLALNDVVSIEKGGSEIAKARVEKLYTDYSAAYITEEQSDVPIQEGYLVRPK